MSDDLVDKIRKESYIIKIFKLTKDEQYVNSAKKIIEFVKDIYRNLEPSHFDGKIIVFLNFDDEFKFTSKNQEHFYDKSILDNSYQNLIFQIFNNNEKLPLISFNIEEKEILKLLEKSDNFIGYVFEDNYEYFIVNGKRVDINNYFSCPSIYALQYHYLNEALLDYKSKHIRKVSCEHFKKCWADNKWIYFKNKPEKCIQISLFEFLKSRVRGVNVIREYNLGASKPVDIRIFWKEANRSALIEIKWLGQSISNEDTIGTSFTNKRSNEGMSQIKNYIDLENSDSPSVISKGYLVVIDGRRKNINKVIKKSISYDEGFFYYTKELKIEENKQYWKKFNNIEKPTRIFIEPICD